MEQIKISVRNLVEFILRSGDIDNRYGKAAQKEAMQEGSRIHRKIQKQMGSSYQPEVALKIQVGREQYTIAIEGRADGVIVEEGHVTIDEIKGVYQDVSLMEGPVPVHLAQAKCYAYIYALQNQLSEIAVQMTYCNLDTEEIRRFQENYLFAELEGWFGSLMKNGPGSNIRQGRSGIVPLRGLPSHSLTGQGSGNWLGMCTAPSSGKKFCLSRLPPAQGKPSLLCSLR